VIWEVRIEQRGQSVDAGTDRSAQDWFRLMVDMGLAPGLHAMGFTGTGRRYTMDVGRHCAEITIAQSQSLTEGRVRFTLHLRVLARDEWAEQLRVRPYTPAPTTRSTMRTSWEAPIGQIVIVGGYPIEDLWWELEVGQPFDSLAREVLTTLHTFGLPAMSHQIHTR
jgi:hypothetical protein